MEAQELKTVSKGEFFAFIGERDVAISIQGRYPYTSWFTDRRTREMLGKVIGRTVLSDEYIIYATEERIPE